MEPSEEGGEAGEESSVMGPMTKGWREEAKPADQSARWGLLGVGRREEDARGGSWVANLGAGRIVWDLNGESDLDGIPCGRPPAQRPIPGDFVSMCTAVSIEAWGQEGQNPGHVVGTSPDLVTSV